MIVGAIVVLTFAVATATSIAVEKEGRASTATHAIRPVTSDAATVPVDLDRASEGGIVGQSSAWTSSDIYEDPCARFAGGSNTTMANRSRALADGSLRVRYHLLRLLDDRSSPENIRHAPRWRRWRSRIPPPGVDVFPRRLVRRPAGEGSPATTPDSSTSSPQLCTSRRAR